MDLGRSCAEQDVAVIAINSNDYEQYPDDTPARMRSEAATYGFTFPYLLDADQTVAKAFQAACTPDFFVFDGERKLVYRGQFDDSRPGNEITVSGGDVRAAVDAVLAGKHVAQVQSPSLGCNIKWKPGNAPAWAG